MRSYAKLKQAGESRRPLARHRWPRNLQGWDQAIPRNCFSLEITSPVESPR
jgi:hypothetical protein